MTFNEVLTSASHNRRVVTRTLRQYDYGIKLIISGVSLPNVYEVHFSNSKNGGNAKVSLGDESGVLIPDEYLITGETIYAWVYLHTEQDDGESVYLIEIPVEKRPAPDPSEPTPVQQDIITQAIAVLNSAVEQTAEDVEATTQARNEAVSAAEEAEASASDADESERAAKGHADRAENAANSASNYADRAGTYASEAMGYAEDASESATRAEQVAVTNGYMEVRIVDGHLIYERTDAVDTDFRLDNIGHLIMESVAT